MSKGELIERFVDGYEKLCNETGAYLVFDDSCWIQEAGEPLDISEAAQCLEDMLNAEVAS